jgi:hypothetical protein
VSAFLSRNSAAASSAGQATTEATMPAAANVPTFTTRSGVKIPSVGFGCVPSLQTAKLH